jgi:hypothetical protein
MPCRSDYLEANGSEIESREIAQMLVVVYGIQGAEVPPWVTGSTGYYGGDIDRLTDSLCSILQSLKGEDLESLFRQYDGRHPRSLRYWWQTHQLADKRRLEEELQKAKEAKDREEVLARLTDYEKELLGITD